MPELGNTKPPKEYVEPKVENIGEEFIKWVEEYWAFERMFTKGFATSKENEESCPYSYVRKVFIGKINELSKNMYEKDFIE